MSVITTPIQVGTGSIYNPLTVIQGTTPPPPFDPSGLAGGLFGAGAVATVDSAAAFADTLKPITDLADTLNQLEGQAAAVDYGGLVVFGIGCLLVIIAVIGFTLDAGESVASDPNVKSGARRVGVAAKAAAALA